MPDAPDLWDKAKFTWPTIFWNAQIIWECSGICKPEEDMDVLGNALAEIGKNIINCTSNDELRTYAADLFSIGAILFDHVDQFDPRLDSKALEAIRVRQSTFLRDRLDKAHAEKSA